MIPMKAEEKIESGSTSDAEKISVQKTDVALNMEREDMAWNAGVRILAGVREPSAEADVPFSEEVMAFLDAFSKKIRTSAVRTEPDAAALGFWCRRAHLEALKKKHETDTVRLGRGLVFHLAPSNVPMMFVYSYAVGLLAGNANIVRVSSRLNDTARQVAEILDNLMQEEAFQRVRERSSFIQYDRNDDITAEYLKRCDARVFWGGDETVQSMNMLPAPPHAVTLAFPDRWSFALFDEDYMEGLSDEEMASLVHRFYNDTFVMDQQGCSSPQMVVWLKSGNKEEKENKAETGADEERNAQTAGADEDRNAQTVGEPGSETAGKRFWQALAKEAEEDYIMDGYRAARKFERFCVAAMQDDLLAGSERFGGNRVLVAKLSRMPEKPFSEKGGFGLFYEADAHSWEELLPLLARKVQTIVCAGIDRKALALFLAQHHAGGVDRLVEPGQALEMDTIWDGKDLIAALSRFIVTG